MKKNYLILIVALFGLITSCESTKSTDLKDSSKKSKDQEVSNFEKRIEQEVRTKLNIPANEKFEMKVYKEHLNGDDLEDAIITVNRLEFAMNEAAASKKNTAKMAELGYMGNYNYFFYYDGKVDRISIPLTIGSSAKAPLKVLFENVQSQAYKDVIIEYRIRNSCFRNYYLLENGSLLLVFQWNVFDMIGTENYKANYFSYQPGTLSLAKDIVIHKGKINKYSSKISDVYSYAPVIENDGEELYRFFYDPRQGAYVTQKPK